MSKIGQNAKKSDKIENLAFEILMESVLKMAQLMNVSVFVLVENGAKRRRYGGSGKLCDAYFDGTLAAQKRDIQLRVIETETRDHVEPQHYCSSEQPEVNFEDIVETEEIVEDAEEDEDVGEDPDDPDWVEEMPKRKSRSRRKSSDDDDDEIPDESWRKPKTKDASGEGDELAREIQDYAEGRGNYEESWDPDVAEFMAIQGLVEDGHESGADAGGIHDSSDDDWKPVNYGKGKHYQKEKKKYHQKEKKRRAKKDAVATDTISEAPLSSDGGLERLHQEPITESKPLLDQKLTLLCNNGDKGYNDWDSIEVSMGQEVTSNVKLVQAVIKTDKKRFSESGICPHCNQHFNKVKQHVQEVHQSERKYSCEYCAMRFKRDAHLKKHLRSVHKVS